MNNQTILLRSPPGNRRLPLLIDQSPNTVNEKRRFAEVAGGTAAGCAAICCCCPCSMMNLLILTIYKVPKGLCKKLWNKKRHHFSNKKKGLLQPTSSGLEYPARDSNENDGKEESESESESLPLEDMELENEMWDRFSGTGFWRTPSQRQRELLL